MEQFIALNEENISSEHICCAFSDKKCAVSYEAKKKWLTSEFANGYKFLRLNERAKVFMEYGPAENAWLPIRAENCLNINCFWVSGKYKGTGLGKELLNRAESEARGMGRAGLVTVAGKKKFHFMSDGKWLQKQGFSILDETDSGFVLLVKSLEGADVSGSFLPDAKKGTCPVSEGLTVYYSNRCPYSEYHVKESLTLSAAKRNIPLYIVKLETREQAQSSPSPATIFSLFYRGSFLTTDISVCLDSRFDKFRAKAGF